MSTWSGVSDSWIVESNDICGVEVVQRELRRSIVGLQFQSCYNSHTIHCYVMLFVADKDICAIIEVLKTVQCSVSCTPGIQKVGGQKKFFTSGASEIVPPPAKPWRRPWIHSNIQTLVSLKQSNRVGTTHLTLNIFDASVKAQCGERRPTHSQGQVDCVGLQCLWIPYRLLLQVRLSRDVLICLTSATNVTDTLVRLIIV